jgi:uncharacterized protein (UPF0264 family)
MSQIPLKLGNATEVIDHDIFPVIKRINSTSIGICTMGSHGGDETRFYFNYAKYKQLIDYIVVEIYKADGTRKSAGIRLRAFLENAEKFDARPFWFSLKDGIVIYVYMKKKDIEEFCKLWDDFFFRSQWDELNKPQI